MATRAAYYMAGALSAWAADWVLRHSREDWVVDITYYREAGDRRMKDCQGRVVVGDEVVARKLRDRASQDSLCFAAVKHRPAWCPARHACDKGCVDAAD